MKIEPCDPEIIGIENYHPTDLDRLFINPDDTTLVVVGYDTAIKITIPRN